MSLWQARIALPGKCDHNTWRRERALPASQIAVRSFNRCSPDRRVRLRCMVERANLHKTWEANELHQGQ